MPISLHLCPQFSARWTGGWAMQAWICTSRWRVRSQRQMRVAALGPAPRVIAAVWLSLALLLCWLITHPDLGLQLQARVPGLTYQDPFMLDMKHPNQYVPLSPYNFSYIIANEQLCGHKPLQVVLFAYTSTTDVAQRNTIRATWGNRKLLDSLSVRLVFPLGLATDDLVSKHIKEESVLYGDIIQAGFVDSYHNLSYKGLLMFQWTAKYCSNARFLLKVDVDIFVNIGAVLPFLKENYSNERRFFGCKVYWRSAVLRPGDWCGKWCVDDSEYRARVYPPYCWGSFYVVSAELAPLLAQTAARVPIWWIADVYLTGILPRVLGHVKHIVLRDYLEENPDNLLDRLKQNPTNTMFGFIRGTYEVRRLWMQAQKARSLLPKTVNHVKNSSLKIHHMPESIQQTGDNRGDKVLYTQSFSRRYSLKESHLALSLTKQNVLWSFFKEIIIIS